MSAYLEREPDIEAQVTFLATEEGGRQTPAYSGYRPAHLVKENYLTTGVQHYIGQEELAPGDSCQANIWFIAPEEYPNCIWVGKVIQFQEGAIVIGHAQVTKIYNDVLLRNS